MIRIDIPQSKLEAAEQFLGRYFDEFSLDYENDEDEEVVFEYWWNGLHSDGDSNKIYRKYPKIRWDCVLNEHEVSGSWDFVREAKLAEGEKQEQFTYYVADLSGIYENDYSVREGEPFPYQELIDLYYKFENGENISAAVARYVRKNKGDSYILSNS